MIGPHLSPLAQGEETGPAASERSSRLFLSLIVYRDVGSRSAALNMAMDEALLEIATEPTIRFYRWDHPALSFGYFGKFSEIANHETERDIVRRWTGGGIVFHGDDLTYSLIVPPSDPASSESSRSIYQQTHQAMLGALLDIGTELAVESTRNTKDSTFNTQCFAAPVRADLMLNGKKIAGAAQRRTRRGLLQQGS